MIRLSGSRIIIFGLGGVGSWAAEALLRSGATTLALVDDDAVAPSNLNRQLQAAENTLGMPKADVLKERLLSIDSSARIEAICKRYTPASEFTREMLSGYDAVIDAIDSVGDKCDLIRKTTLAGVPIFSSMGAALRLDPAMVRTGDFSRVRGDGLARALRNRFKKDGYGTIPRFMCVYSEEAPMQCEERGSLVTVTATFGMALASLAIGSIARGREAGK